MTIDLAALGAPIAAQLLPGWAVSWHPTAEAEMPMAGALAVCDPTPTRSIAKVYVVTPWPAGESLAETLWHELTHAALSPLTALLPPSDGAVMVEEQIVERLGILLSKVPQAARRALTRAVADYAPQLRARISALAPRARGGQMDPKLIMAALDALIAGDAEKCAEILKGLVAAAAGAGGAPAPEGAPAAEPDGDESAKMAAPPPAEGDEKKPAEAPPAEGARVVARKGTETMSDDAKRARKAADDLEAMAKDARANAVPALITRLRARLGSALSPAAEKRILAASSYAEAKALADFAEEMSGGPQRARSGVEHGVTPDTAGGAKVAPWTAATLQAEGIPAPLAAEIVAQHAKSPALAENSLQHARARLGAASNPWAAKATNGATNGATKG